MHRFWLSILMVAATALAGSAQAQDGAPAAPPVVTMTLEQLTAQIEAERAALEERGASEAEWLMFEGKVLKLTGQYAGSATAYRRVLALEPQNLVARQELAHALFLARDFRAAKFHFEALERGGPQRECAGALSTISGIDRPEPAVWGERVFFDCALDECEPGNDEYDLPQRLWRGLHRGGEPGDLWSGGGTGSVGVFPAYLEQYAAGRR